LSFLFQGSDQFDGRGEADVASMTLDQMESQGCGGLGLAGAATADQPIVGVVRNA